MKRKPKTSPITGATTMKISVLFLQRRSRHGSACVSADECVHVHSIFSVIIPQG